MKAKRISLFITAFFILMPIFSQRYTIDYFGIVADGVDDNMSKMTSDLYYTQLSEINSYTVNDKRVGIRMSSVPDSADFDDGKLSFYAVISKKERAAFLFLNEFFKETYIVAQMENYGHFHIH